MQIDVIELAREAGFRTGIYESLAATKFARSIGDDCEVELARFAQLVQQATAEKCANLCDAQMTDCECPERAAYCAAAIREKFADKGVK